MKGLMLISHYTIAYALLQGHIEEYVDSQHVDRLIHNNINLLIHKLNVIPFNSTLSCRFCCSSNDTEKSFNNPGEILSESEEMLIHFDGTYPPIPGPNSRFQPIDPAERYGFRLCFTSGEFY